RASEELTNAENRDYEFTSTALYPLRDTTISLETEFGGLLEFTSEDDRLSLGAGLFYLPSYERVSTSRDDEVIEQSVSYEDDDAADLDTGSVDTAADAEGAFDDIRDTNVAGSGEQTETTSWDGNDVTATLTHEFQIPASVRYAVLENLHVISGYRLSHGVETVRETTATSRTVTETKVTDSDGNSETQDDEGDVVEGEDTVSSASLTDNAWTGQAEWMIRWQPQDYMTLDITGTSALAALNQSLLDFNPSAFINNLDISATFRF
ncbi:MAG: hypothetical protein ACLFM0_08705, partial [Spirochaetales bacterium]